MEKAEALATLRRTLEAFHGRRTTITRPNGSKRHGPIVMVAELTQPQMAEALNALAELEREPASTAVTFVLWDDATDGVAVKHDGETVWTEQSFDSLDQYLRHYAPSSSTPTAISWEVVEGGEVTDHGNEPT